ncbi:histidinol-phosphatase [Protofrankia sp. BMG5.30]|uniref:Histidinol-phosphatase n=1 Tax=Protofrankia coriariae TaxID=1562887 RepID=A0ABR5F4Y5_9ACTN|nr:histidinol phosphatase [Protofrankia coriariae]ONH38353.1 histidinol-phosphatase [Protofrankia sp. BMG5.30]
MTNAAQTDALEAVGTDLPGSDRQPASSGARPTVDGYATTGHPIGDDLALALALADAADAITLARFQAVDLRVEAKPDATPVTDADTAVEAMIRARLAESRPGDAVLGEEQGLIGADTRRRWVVDPVDGTKNFVRGVPVWGTLLALEVDGEVVVGVASAPAMGRRWWAARGQGAHTRTAVGETRSLAVSAVADLADAYLSFASVESWSAAGRLAPFLGLVDAVWRTRAYGDFWSHMMVAEGAVDLACEPDVSLWDMAALQVIVEEAGGTFTDLTGRRGPGGGSILTTNGRLHTRALDILNQPAQPAVR